MSNTPDNLRLWNRLGKTDPRHTKQFKRAGGFSGTALKPIWVEKMLTDHFGPCGTGWGMDKPEFQIVPGENREVLVYCMLTAWYMEDGKRRDVFGVGGDKIVTYIKANEQYNRPERWENDDEAFKKASTDALGNAFKHLGVGADIHMGQFDDSKYVNAVGREFVEAERAAAEPAKSPPVKLNGPYTSKSALWAAVRAFDRELRGCGDEDEMDIFLSTEDSVALLAQIDRDAPQLAEGGDGLPAEYEPINSVVQRMRDEFRRDAQTMLSAG